MSDDFGISLGGEDVAFLDEFFLQAEVVLDDTVVDHNNLAGAVAMRMRIFFGGTSMGGPASMANAVGAVERLQADDFFEIAQLAFGAANLETVSVTSNRDAGRVVAAVFKASEPFKDDGNNRFLPHVANDPTHR